MNRKSRFVIAVGLSIILLLIAAGTWAAPKFQGTVPSRPLEGSSTCSEGTIIDMKTAIFTPKSIDCSIKVERVEDPAELYVSAPEGKVFVGDTFNVTANSKQTIVEVCYAYPPEFAEKEAMIYRLNEDATPNVWIDVPGSVVENGTICVTSVVGVFTLIGNP